MPTCLKVRSRVASNLTGALVVCRVVDGEGENMIVHKASFVERKNCIACGSTSLIEIASGYYDEHPLCDFIAEDPWGENPLPFLWGSPWSYVKCAECGQAFHKYILNPDWNERRFSVWMSQEAIEKFERNSRTPDRLFRRGIQNVCHILRLEQMLRTTVQRDTPLRLLDFGCGYGEFLSMCCLFGIDAYGVDRAAARREGNRFLKVFEDLSFIQDTEVPPFHVVTLFEVLEHLDDPKDTLLAIREHMAPDSILVLETPDCSGTCGINTIDDYRKIHPLDHINAFTPESLMRFAKSVGFKPARKPIAHVTCRPSKLLKTYVRQLVPGFKSQSTQQYFVKQ